jgi:hypothetical protein
MYTSEQGKVTKFVSKQYDYKCCVSMNEWTGGQRLYT